LGTRDGLLIQPFITYLLLSSSRRMNEHFGIQSLKIGREETMLNTIVSKFPSFMDI
jgi:hypothetical protein